MNTKFFLAITTINLVVVGISASPSRAAETTIEQMPAKLETQFAQSALPPEMRDKATVYLLDPAKGYQRSLQGTSGVTCLVSRTEWDQADFRNDIYVPFCYDAEGSKTFLKVIMDVATLRVQGMSPVALKAEIVKRYKNRTYKAPEKSGLSYMAAPIMRTWMPDGNVHTMPMPHLMFYAPNITNDDIGAVPASSSNFSPFVIKDGVAEQSYIIHLVGESEKAKILADEKGLLAALCTYRASLCLPH
ncbi:hypothetical protein [Dokdonella soli]|uniref:Uncharacterized protein n=1 Tax=Dokdonella soli TaxID=529810 RepID=A0ABN1IQQ6_9GAMM